MLVFHLSPRFSPSTFQHSLPFLIMTGPGRLLPNDIATEHASADGHYKYKLPPPRLGLQLPSPLSPARVWECDAFRCCE
ncbi:hypothetical protein BDR03DRAFT_393101 [Suillus americanus]|nr:hypothetical protein BDR03DRAFT_393101 [Suillus americanus]